MMCLLDIDSGEGVKAVLRRCRVDPQGLADYFASPERGAATWAANCFEMIDELLRLHPFR